MHDKPLKINVVCKVAKFGDGISWQEVAALQNLPHSPYAIGLMGLCTDFVCKETDFQQVTAMILPYKAGGCLRDFLWRKGSGE